MDDRLHQTLKRSRRTEEALRGGDPLELPSAGQREGSVGPGLGLQH